MTFVHLRFLNITMIHVYCNAEFVGFVHGRKIIVRFVHYCERLQGRETRFISALDCHALRIPFFVWVITMYILILQYIAVQIKVYEYLWLETHCELLSSWFFKVVYKNKFHVNYLKKFPTLVSLDMNPMGK